MTDLLYERDGERQIDWIDEVQRYGQILLRRRWILIATFVISIVVAAIYSRHQVPVYRANASLIIESEVPQLSKLDAKGRSETSDNFFPSQIEVIRSYAVAERAYYMLGLADATKSADGSDPVAAFQAQFKVEPVRRSQLVLISSTGLEPEPLAERVNALAKAYVQHNLEDRHRSSNDAFVWLSEQLRILEMQVAESERDLLGFKAKEDILSLDRRRALLEERLSGWSERLTEAAVQRVERETMLVQLQELRSQPATLEALPPALHNATIQKLKEDYLGSRLELAQLSRKYKPKHPRIVDLESRIDNLGNSMRAEIDKVASSIEIQYRTSQTTEQAVARHLEDLKRESSRLAAQAIEYAVLQREAESNRQMYDVMLQRLKETDIGGKITVNNVRIVDRARVPTVPVGPSAGRMLYFGAFWGLALGLLLCYVIDRLDGAVRSEEDVEFYLRVPVIGAVPEDRSQPLGSPAFLQAYRDIRSRLSIYARERRLGSLLITSTLPQEGKTTTLVQLGQAFAQAGSKVLLVDGDLYRPRLRNLFDIASDAGLTEVVLGERQAQEVIVETETPNLYILPAGLLPPDPADVLESDALGGLLADWKEAFDIVLIESAPLSAGLQSAALGRMVDGVAWVVRANATSRAPVKKALRRLSEMRVSVLGVVLTAVAPSAETASYHYGSYVQPVAGQPMGSAGPSLGET